MATGQPQPIVVQTTKSVGVAILLTVILGPLGMLYATIPGALIMMVISFLILVSGFFTFGLGYTLFFITYPLTIIWAAMAASSHNKKLIAGAQRKVIPN